VYADALAHPVGVEFTDEWHRGDEVGTGGHADGQHAGPERPDVRRRGRERRRPGEGDTGEDDDPSPGDPREHVAQRESGERRAEPDQRHDRADGCRPGVERRLQWFDERGEDDAPEVDDEDHSEETPIQVAGHCPLVVRDVYHRFRFAAASVHLRPTAVDPR
jgi:hypothetical protein